MVEQMRYQRKENRKKENKKERKQRTRKKQENKRNKADGRTDRQLSNLLGQQTMLFSIMVDKSRLQM